MARGADPRYDYAYGNTPASYRVGARPWFQFIKAMLLPTPGAMEYGLETQQLAWRPMIGPAIGQAIQFRTIYNLTPANTQYLQAAAFTTKTGLGGLASGTLVVQPLADPYNG